MKSLRILGFFIAILSLAACKCKKCDLQLRSDQKAMIIYNEGDRLHFENDENQEIILYWTQKEETLQAGSCNEFNEVCLLSITQHFYTDYGSSSVIQDELYGNMSISVSDTKDFVWQLEILDRVISQSALDNNLQVVDGTIALIDTLTLFDTINYTSVYQIDFSNTASWISRMFYHPSEGILRIEAAGENWSLKEKE